MHFACVCDDCLAALSARAVERNIATDALAELAALYSSRQTRLLATIWAQARIRRDVGPNSVHTDFEAWR